MNNENIENINEDIQDGRMKDGGMETDGMDAGREDVPATEVLRERLTALVSDSCVRQKDTVNGMMAPEFLQVDAADLSAVFRYIVRPWEANRVGGLHGGIMVSMLDHACGLMASAWLGHWAPTMSMNIDYIRPAKPGDHLLATTAIISPGRRLIRVHGQLAQESSGKIVATCSATFFNKEA